MYGAGSSSAMNSTLKENRKLRKNSIKRYRKLREIYTGNGNEYNNNTSSTLDPQHIAEGRKRAIAYYKERNRRIWIQIIVVSAIVLTLATCMFYKWLL